MMMNVTLPAERFNAAVSDGSVGPTIRAILDEIKPEAAYFTEQDGHRGAILIVDVPEPSRIPSLAEPWFLKFNATVNFRIIMSAEELAHANLEALGRKWAAAS
jgi:hypothetical protein